MLLRFVHGKYIFTGKFFKRVVRRQPRQQVIFEERPVQRQFVQRVRQVPRVQQRIIQRVRQPQVIHLVVKLRIVLSLGCSRICSSSPTEPTSPICSCQDSQEQQLP